MKQVTGTKDTPLFVYEDDVWKVRWGGKEDSSGNWTYYEVSYPSKPSLENIKDFVLSMENLRIDKEILTGFVWNGMNVWLSSENQFNYKASYDLAAQTNGANLPVTLKFGDTENPKYHEFKTLEDIADFYLKAMNHVNSTLKKGWEEKDSIDWTKYE